MVDCLPSGPAIHVGRFLKESCFDQTFFRKIWQPDYPWKLCFSASRARGFASPDYSGFAVSALLANIKYS